MYTKTLSTLMVVLIAFTLSGCVTSTVQTNPSASGDVDSYTMIKEKEYQRGYEDAIKENRDKWVQEGFESAKRTLKLYKQDMQAYQAGMYAIKEKLITNPRIYGVRDASGAVALKVVGSQIVPEKTPDAILDFYKRYKDYIEVIDKSNSLTNTQARESKPDIDSVGIVSYYQGAESEIAKPKESAKIVRTFEKTYKFTNAIDVYGLNCTLSNSTYICSFNSQEALQEFCSQSGECQ